MRRMVGLLAGVLVGVGVAGALVPPALAATRRDPLQQPFAVDSIWNTPVGRDARYVPAGLPAGTLGVERVTVVAATRGGRVVPVLAPDCTTPPLPRKLPVTLPVAAGTLAVISADGRAAETWTSFRRCGEAPRGPVGGRYAGRARLDGDGVPVGGAVAGLPGLGGTLRAAEQGGAPVRHALALSVPARYMAPGNRWPAIRSNGTRSTATSGPSLRVGALLALSPADAAGLRPATPLGQELVAALRDHGAYVVGVAGTFRLRVEGRVPPAALADLKAALPGLAVIDDNAPGTVGGAGARRAAPAAPLAGLRPATASPAPSVSPSVLPSVSPVRPSPSRSASTPQAAPARLPAAPAAQVGTGRQAPPAGVAVVGVLAVMLLAVGLRVGRSAVRVFS